METQRGRRAAALATVAVLAMACLAGPAAALDERKPPPLSGRLTCTSARARTSGPLAVEVEL
ncbi:MAG: hypothetical protein ACYS9X_00570, partial [Planctomycetota bacterium]